MLTPSLFENWCLLKLGIITSQMLQNRTIEGFEETLHSFRRIPRHNVKNRLSTTELVFLLMIWFSWTYATQRSISEYHLRPYVHQSTSNFLKFITDAAEIHDLQQNNILPVSYDGIFFLGMRSSFLFKNAVFIYWKVRWCHMMLQILPSEKLQNMTVKRLLCTVIIDMSDWRPRSGVLF